MSISIDYWKMFLDTLKVLWQMWPLLVLMATLLIIKLVFEKWLPDFVDSLKNKLRFRKGSQWRSDRDMLHWLRAMHPSEFEQYIAHLFTQLGYKAYAVGQSHDGGIDVIAEKDGVKSYIQCKKFITREVTVGAVRDFCGALAHHYAHAQGYFITTNTFTLEARKFAESEPIELVDGFKLVEYIHMAEKKQKAEPTISEINVCPSCGGALIPRDGKYGKFYGCSNYPTCTYTVKS